MSGVLRAARRSLVDRGSVSVLPGGHGPLVDATCLVVALIALLAHAQVLDVEVRRLLYFLNGVKELQALVGANNSFQR